jgi:hypothetical protein
MHRLKSLKDQRPWYPTLRFPTQGAPHRPPPDSTVICAQSAIRRAQSHKPFMEYKTLAGANLRGLNEKTRPDSSPPERGCRA